MFLVFVSALIAILVAVGIAFLFKEAFRRVGIPRTVGEVLAGIVLTVPFLHQIFFSDATRSVFSTLSDIGMILLFFFVGLKIDLGSAKKNFREAFAVSLASTIVLFFAGVAVSVFLLNLSIVQAAIVGIALAVSGVALSVDFLEEMGLLKTHVANIIVTAGAIADIIQFVLIGVIFTLLNTALGQTTLLIFFVQVFIFSVFVVGFKLLVVPWALKFFAREKSEPSIFAGGIMITLSMAVLAEFAGLGSFMGALIAGLIVRRALRDEQREENPAEHVAVWERHILTKSIHTIGFGFLVPLVFVWVGMNVDLSFLISEIPVMLLLVFIAFSGMLFGSVAGVIFSKGSLKEGILIGLGVSPKGDIELVIATLALSKGIISQNIFAPLVGMAIITTLVAPLLFKFLLNKWSGELGGIAGTKF